MFSFFRNTEVVYAACTLNLSLCLCITGTMLRIMLQITALDQVTALHLAVIAVVQTKDSLCFPKCRLKQHMNLFYSKISASHPFKRYIDL